MYVCFFITKLYHKFESAIRLNSSPPRARTDKEVSLTRLFYLAFNIMQRRVSSKLKSDKSDTEFIRKLQLHVPFYLNTNLDEETQHSEP